MAGPRLSAIVGKVVADRPHQAKWRLEVELAANYHQAQGKTTANDSLRRILELKKGQMV